MGNSIKKFLQISIYQKQPNVSKAGKLKILGSGVIGILIGVITTFFVNAALLEISLNSLFSLVIFKIFCIFRYFSYKNDFSILEYFL